MIEWIGINEEPPQETAGKKEAQLTRETEVQMGLGRFNLALNFQTHGGTDRAKEIYQELLDLPVCKERLEPVGIAGIIQVLNVHSSPIHLLQFVTFKNYALVLEDDGDEAGAMTYILKALSVDSTDYSLWSRLSFLASKHHDIPLARKSLTYTAKTATSQAVRFASLEALCDLLFRTGDYVRCLRYVNSTLTERPDWTRGLWLKKEILSQYANGPMKLISQKKFSETSSSPFSRLPSFIGVQDLWEYETRLKHIHLKEIVTPPLLRAFSSAPPADDSTLEATDRQPVTLETSSPTWSQLGALLLILSRFLLDSGPLSIRRGEMTILNSPKSLDLRDHLTTRKFSLFTPLSISIDAGVAGPAGGEQVGEATEIEQQGEKDSPGIEPKTGSVGESMDVDAQLVEDTSSVAGPSTREATSRKRKRDATAQNANGEDAEDEEEDETQGRRRSQRRPKGAFVRDGGKEDVDSTVTEHIATNLASELDKFLPQEFSFDPHLSQKSKAMLWDPDSFVTLTAQNIAFGHGFKRKRKALNILRQQGSVSSSSNLESDPMYNSLLDVSSIKAFVSETNGLPLAEWLSRFLSCLLLGNHVKIKTEAPCVWPSEIRAILLEATRRLAGLNPVGLLPSGCSDPPEQEEFYVSLCELLLDSLPDDVDGSIEAEQSLSRVQVLKLINRFWHEGDICDVSFEHLMRRMWLRAKVHELTLNHEHAMSSFRYCLEIWQKRPQSQTVINLPNITKDSEISEQKINLKIQELHARVYLDETDDKFSNSDFAEVVARLRPALLERKGEEFDRNLVFMRTYVGQRGVGRKIKMIEKLLEAEGKLNDHVDTWPSVCLLFVECVFHLIEPDITFTELFDKVIRMGKIIEESLSIERLEILRLFIFRNGTLFDALVESVILCIQITTSIRDIVVMDKVKGTKESQRMMEVFVFQAWVIFYKLASSLKRSTPRNITDDLSVRGISSGLDETTNDDETEDFTGLFALAHDHLAKLSCCKYNDGDINLSAPSLKGTIPLDDHLVEEKGGTLDSKTADEVFKLLLPQARRLLSFRSTATQRDSIRSSLRKIASAFGENWLCDGGFVANRATIDNFIRSDIKSADLSRDCMEDLPFIDLAGRSGTSAQVEDPPRIRESFFELFYLEGSLIFMEYRDKKTLEFPRQTEIFEEVIALFQKNLTLNPKEWRAWSAMALAYMRLSQSYLYDAGATQIQDSIVNISNMQKSALHCFLQAARLFRRTGELAFEDPLSTNGSLWADMGFLVKEIVSRPMGSHAITPAEERALVTRMWCDRSKRSSDFLWEPKPSTTEAIVSKALSDDSGGQQHHLFLEKTEENMDERIRLLQLFGDRCFRMAMKSSPNEWLYVFMAARFADKLNKPFKKDYRTTHTILEKALQWKEYWMQFGTSDEWTKKVGITSLHTRKCRVISFSYIDQTLKELMSKTEDVEGLYTILERLALPKYKEEMVDAEKCWATAFTNLLTIHQKRGDFGNVLALMSRTRKAAELNGTAGSDAWDVAHKAYLESIHRQDPTLESHVAQTNGMPSNFGNAITKREFEKRYAAIENVILQHLDDCIGSTSNEFNCEAFHKRIQVLRKLCELKTVNDGLSDDSTLDNLIVSCYTKLWRDVQSIPVLWNRVNKRAFEPPSPKRKAEDKVSTLTELGPTVPKKEKVEKTLDPKLRLPVVLRRAIAFHQLLTKKDGKKDETLPKENALSSSRLSQTLISSREDREADEHEPHLTGNGDTLPAHEVQSTNGLNGSASTL
ncbi:hypothetical protein M427DRAFT_141903 [Gonapodya prolifera JEL478]|uniref:Histone transcription regulator 3 homolog n=1 Tax=Gonapodya prolifera (strain JEL478) TaxID=1344416 RepID=A0A139B0E5_GONPJ|nr:hypothetical protein M427DRAFT_141903 [Gonapodya prolifera JEL478]|eukprot:KXS22444.1 hypothetical protein M427DRAFT_141903 [Gonapodya prolifera JEL478]